jgi:hypothetical protein
MQRETLIQIGMERATNEPTAIKIYDLAWDAGSDDDKTLLETVCCIYQGVDWGVFRKWHRDVILSATPAEQAVWRQVNKRAFPRELRQ